MKIWSNPLYRPVVEDFPTMVYDYVECDGWNPWKQNYLVRGTIEPVHGEKHMYLMIYPYRYFATTEYTIDGTDYDLPAGWYSLPTMIAQMVTSTGCQIDYDASTNVVAFQGTFSTADSVLDAFLGQDVEARPCACLFSDISYNKDYAPADFEGVRQYSPTFYKTQDGVFHALGKTSIQNERFTFNFVNKSDICDYGTSSYRVWEEINDPSEGNQFDLRFEETKLDDLSFTDGDSETLQIRLTTEPTLQKAFAPWDQYYTLTLEVQHV